ITCCYHLLTLRIGKDLRVKSDSLALAKAFIAEKGEGLVLDNRAAEVRSKLVPLECGLGRHRGVEKVSGIEGIITQELKQLSMIGIGAGAGGDIHNRARVAAVFGAVGRIVNLEFRNRVNGG